MAGADCHVRARCLAAAGAWYATLADRCRLVLFPAKA
jgi:hypothetical protein